MSAEHMEAHSNARQKEVVASVATSCADVPFEACLRTIEQHCDLNDCMDECFEDAINGFDVTSCLRCTAGDSTLAKAGAVAFQTFLPAEIEAIDGAMDAFYAHCKEILPALVKLTCLRDAVCDVTDGARELRNKRFPKTTTALLASYAMKNRNGKAARRADAQLRALLETVPLQ